MLLASGTQLMQHFLRCREMLRCSIHRGVLNCLRVVYFPLPVSLSFWSAASWGLIEGVNDIKHLWLSLQWHSMKSCNLVLVVGLESSLKRGAHAVLQAVVAHGCRFCSWSGPSVAIDESLSNLALQILSVRKWLQFLEHGLVFARGGAWRRFLEFDVHDGVWALLEQDLLILLHLIICLFALGLVVLYSILIWYFARNILLSRKSGRLYFVFSVFDYNALHLVCWFEHDLATCFGWSYAMSLWTFLVELFDSHATRIPSRPDPAKLCSA